MPPMHPRDNPDPGIRVARTLPASFYRSQENYDDLLERGSRSRLYQRGRSSPEREQGIHPFQRLLAEALASS